MVLLNTLAIVVTIIIGIGFVIKSWVVLMIDASVRYRILVSLLCVLMLLSLFFLALITMFDFNDTLDSCK